MKTLLLLVLLYLGINIQPDKVGTYHLKFNNSFKEFISGLLFRVTLQQSNKHIVSFLCNTDVIVHLRFQVPCVDFFWPRYISILSRKIKSIIT